MNNRITGRLEDGTIFVRSETGDDGTGYFVTQQRLPEILSKLAAYEDAEEQGRIIVPPCKVGDTVYVVIPDFDEVKKGEVTRLEYDMYRSDGAWIETSIGKTCLPLLRLKCSFDQIGKTVFLTREEAERALVERSGE